MSLLEPYLIHLAALAWFMLCWIGYSHYAAWKARSTPCLASVLHLYRQDWMRRLLLRDNRIADASVIGNLERNASFFASSTLIILAGILTVLGSTERAVSPSGSKFCGKSTRKSWMACGVASRASVRAADKLRPLRWASRVRAAYDMA